MGAYEFPRGIAQNLRVPSAVLEISKSPSGLKARSVTADVWPLSIWTSSPRGTAQSFTVLSVLAEARTVPVELKAAAATRRHGQRRCVRASRSARPRV